MAAVAQQHWPIDPIDQEHPIGNSFGEYQYYLRKGSYHHQGIDILAKPMIDDDGEIDPSAPWVRATMAGTVEKVIDGEHFDNYISIRDDNGILHKYVHLANGSYVKDFKQGDRVLTGDRLAKIARVPQCRSFSHLHYELIKDDSYLNPLAGIISNPDPDRPQIDAIGFALDDAAGGGENGRWQVKSNDTKACTVVDGAVDIVVKGRDQDKADSTAIGVATLWFYNLRWRACPDDDPECAWQATSVLDRFPVSWGKPKNKASAAAYSRTSPWKSDAWYCRETWIYGIATNFINGRPDVSGHWNTTGIADGAYTVSVEATDFSGNRSIHRERVCVQNGDNCVSELTIRNADDDNGAIPYGGSGWQQSPDIQANPGTPDEDRRIRRGQKNTVAVTVWNYGSCNETAGFAYEVCLGWTAVSDTVAHPLPDEQIINCQSESVPADGWSRSSSRVTTFHWTPPPGSLPQGDHFLVAWIDSPADPIRNSPRVTEDDNRAVQRIGF